MRSRDAAQVAHQLRHQLRRVSLLAKRLRVSQSVIALVGSAESRELVSLSLPVEVTAIHHGATHLTRMTVHVLRCGVSDNVCTPFKRTAVDRRSKRVIHNEWHTMPVRHLRKSLDVEHIAARVRNRLAKEALRIWTELLLDALIIPVRVNKRAFNAQLLQRHAKEVERAAINRVRSDEMVTSLTDVEHSIEVGSLSRRREHTAHTTFKRIDFSSHRIIRRILQASIEITLVLKVEQASHRLTRLILECRTLYNRKHTAFPVLWRPASLHAQCFKILFHNSFVTVNK